MAGCDSLKEWASVVGNVGFPMLVAAYVLYRLEVAIHALTSMMTRIDERLERNEP